MKPNDFVRSILFISILAFGAMGCASTPRASDSNPSRTYGASLDQTRAAAIEALAETGFDVTKEEATYLEGFRPRKVGLVVGSGGETIGVWLESSGAGSTRVRVRTAKSFVGIAGQKNWDEAVLDAISGRFGG